MPSPLRETVITTARSLLQTDFASRPREVGELLADDSDACVKRLQAWRDYDQPNPEHSKSRFYYLWELPPLSAFFVDGINNTFRNSKADLTGPGLLAMFLYTSYRDASKEDKSLQVEMLLESARKRHPPAQGIAQIVLRSYGLPISDHLSNAEQDEWLFNAASTGSMLALRELTGHNPELAQAASNQFRNKSGYCLYSALFAEGSHGELKLDAGDSDIHDCAKEGDLDDLKSLLNLKPQEINRRNGMHETPLSKACMAGHSQVVLELCKRGAAANLTHSDYKISCLHWLFNFPAQDVSLVLRTLVAAGANVNHSLATTRPLFNPHAPFTWPPGTPLHWAVATSSAPAISALLNAAADPTIRNGDDPYICDENVRQMHRHGNAEQGEFSETPEHVLGMTPVDLATAAHDWQSLHAISPLAAGKNPSLLSADDEGYTPFHRLSYQRIGRTFSGSRFWYPALKGDIETRRRNLQKTIEWLQAVGGDIDQLTNTPDEPGLSGVAGLSPLMIAVTKYDIEAVEALCGAGANVNLQNRTGRTALTLLHDAHAYHVNPSGVLPDMVACLVRYNADTNYQSPDGLTPLSCIARVGDISAFRSLLEAGADVKCRSRGVSVLGDLIRMNGTNKLVLERVDVHQIEQKDDELSSLLREYIKIGALDVDFMMDGTDATLLHYCAAAALPSCTSTLLSLGAATNISRTALPPDQKNVEFFLRNPLIMGTPEEIISKQKETFSAKRSNRLNESGKFLYYAGF
jgi:ankyrin repeat protein